MTISYCARKISMVPRAALSLALLFAAGIVLADGEPMVPSQPLGLAYTSQVPYLEAEADNSAEAVKWLPFEDLQLDFHAVPQGQDLHSGLSGTWQGPESLSVQAYANRVAPTLPGQAMRHCNSAGAPAMTCVRSAEQYAGAGLQALNYGMRGQWQPLDGLSLGLGYHHRESSGYGARFLLPSVLDFMAPALNGRLVGYGSAMNEGVDIDMAYGFDAGFIGELEFALRLSHDLNRTLNLAGPRSYLSQRWRRAPANRAQMGFNWERGDFRGTLSSRYVDSIFINGQPLPAAWTSLDINFAWRTPWQASVSVGAKNLLGNQPEDLGVDPLLPPELNEAFSRIPYVRYEQDL